MTRIALVGALVAMTACHHDKSVKTTPIPPVANQAPAPAQPLPTVRQNTGGDLHASDDLARACKLHFANTTEAPKFGFDQDALSEADRDLLQQIARCVIDGPLKGKKLHLVGRADPRGTEEYNLALGDRRAHQVSVYLERLGVRGEMIATTTRGALDASGHDDDSWQVDRRVDVEVN